MGCDPILEKKEKVVWKLWGKDRCEEAIGVISKIVR